MRLWRGTGSASSVPVDREPGRMSQQPSQEPSSDSSASFEGGAPAPWGGPQAAPWLWISLGCGGLFVVGLGLAALVAFVLAAPEPADDERSRLQDGGGVVRNLPE